MAGRSRGFVGRGLTWLTVNEASSMKEWPRAQMDEAISFGLVPAIISPSGEMMILESMVRGLDSRLTEHH